MVTHRKIGAAAVFAALALGAPAAQAHAFLDHASPAVGSAVPTAPAAVTMWFTQQLEPAFTTATVTDQAGNRSIRARLRSIRTIRPSCGSR